MNIAQYPDSLSLLGNLKHIIVNDSDPFTLQLAVDGTTVVDESYSPVDGRCEIDFSEVISGRLSVSLPSSDVFRQSSVAKTFTLTVTFSDATTDSKSFTVIRGGVDATAPVASTFLKANFLTWQPQIKRVRRLQPEWLTYYFVEAGKVTARFYTATGTTDVVLGSGSAGTCYSFNVQLAHLLALSGVPSGAYGFVDIFASDTSDTKLSYTQRLVYSPDEADDRYFIAENSLGGIDGACLSGVEIASPERSYVVADYDDDLQQAATTDKRAITKNTGYLTTDEARWVRNELLASAKCYAVIDNVVRSIVIDESSVSDSSQDTLKAFTLKYRVSDIHGLLNLARTDTLPATVELTVPDTGLFFLAARLVDLPEATLDDTLLLLLQSPFSEVWSRISWGSVYSAIFSGVQSSITAALQVLSGYVLQSAFQKSIKDLYDQMAATLAASGSVVIETGVCRGHHIAAATVNGTTTPEHFLDEDGNIVTPRITVLYLDIDTYKLWVYTFTSSTVDGVTTETWFWQCITADVIVSCTHVAGTNSVAEHFVDASGSTISLDASHLYLDATTKKLYMYSEVTASGVTTGTITCLNPDPYYQVATGHYDYTAGIFVGADEHSTALLATANTLFIDVNTHVTFIYQDGSYLALTSGSGIECLYALTADTTAPTKPAASQVDNDIPATLWQPYPQRITASSQYCWVIWRRKILGQWSAWSDPAIAYSFNQGTSLRYRGDWTSGVQYQCNSSYIDTVTYNGQLYICKASHTASGDILPTNESYWGLAAEKGESGSSSYLYIRYATNSSGSGMTATPSTSTTYIGTCVSSSATAPTEASAYTWSRYKGNDGIAGTSSYIHIRYSNDGGTTFTANDGETPGIYIGVLVNQAIGASKDPAAYTWSKIKGDDGTDVEWIYKLTADDSRPTTPVAPNTDNRDDDFPTDWNDDPQDVTISNQFEWCSFRQKVAGTWGAYSTPALWAHYGADGKETEFIYNRSDPGSTAPVAKYGDNRDDDIPDGWTDDPSGVDADYPDEWFSMRRKTDGTWGLYTAPQLWAHYGLTGTAGKDAYLLDLDNAMELLPCDADGAKLSWASWPTTSARLYKGGVLVTSGATYSLTATGCTATGSLSSGVYTVAVTAVSSAEATIAISEAVSGLSVTFRVKKTMATEIFRLRPTPTAIVRSDAGVLTPTTATIAVDRLTGSGIQSGVNWSTSYNLTVKYRLSSGSSQVTVQDPAQNASGANVNPGASDTYLDWYLYDAAGNVIDYERVPVIDAGADGITVQFGYDDNFLSADSTGKNGSAQTKTGHIYVFKGGTAVTPTAISVNGSLPANSDGVTMCGTPSMSLSTASTFTVTFLANVVLQNGQIAFNVTYNGKTYVIYWCFSVIKAAETGAAGAIVRPRGTWTQGSIYIWSSEYRDMVYYNSHYYVVKTKPASGATTSTDPDSFVATEWQQADEFSFIFTRLLFADNALIEFLASTCLRVIDSAGQVCGGIQGCSSTDGGTIIWAGSATPESGKFRVDNNGDVVADNLTAQGAFEVASADGGLVRLANDALSVIDASGNLDVHVTNKAIPSIASLANSISVTPTMSNTGAQAAVASTSSGSATTQNEVLKFSVALASYSGRNFVLSLPAITATVVLSGSAAYGGEARYEVRDSAGSVIASFPTASATSFKVALSGGQNYTVYAVLYAGIRNNTSGATATCTTTLAANTTNATVSLMIEGATVGSDGISVVQDSTHYMHVQHNGTDLLFNMRNGANGIYMDRYGFSVRKKPGYVTTAHTALGSSVSASKITGAVTLSISYPAFLYTVASSAFTITLPLVSSVDSGQRFEFWNLGSATITFQRSGTNGLTNGASSGTSVALAPGKKIEFVMLESTWCYHLD